MTIRKSKSKGHSLTCLDLFAGCGGLSLGLENAGFSPLLVSEINPDAMMTYLANRSGKQIIQNEDIYQLTDSKLEKYLNEYWKTDIDLLAGGPPCQGYSGIGHRRTFKLNKNEIPSNQLYQEMVRVINKVRPKIFLFENVKGLLSSKWTKGGEKGEIWSDVKSAFLKINGYVARPALLEAKYYGVPQNRPRVIIIGIRQDIQGCPPKDCADDAVDAGLLPKGKRSSAPNIQALLSDIVDEDYLENKATEIYKKNPATRTQMELRSINGKLILKKGDILTQQKYSSHNDDIRKKFQWMIDNQPRNKDEMPKKWQTKKFAQRVLPAKWDKEPNITATSLPDDYVHYCQPRILTVREWARLQTFPDWYDFRGPRTTGGRRRAGDPKAGIWDRDVPRYTQIGNAVPVLLAEKIGQHIEKLIKG